MSAKHDQPLPKHIQTVLAESSQADYDGHTEFARMTPAQRLAWLDQAVLFIHRNKPKGQLGAVKATGGEILSTKVSSENAPT